MARWLEAPDHGVIEVTDWAREILTKAQAAAARFDPDVRIRLARSPTGIEALLAATSESDDEAVEVDGMTLYVESGLDGMVDVEEPHDRLVLRPHGSRPNPRGDHG